MKTRRDNAGGKGVNRVFKNGAGETARIGRYAWNIKSPLFGLYFVDIIGRFGLSSNVGVPEHFRTYADAKAYLCQLGFVPANE